MTTTLCISGAVVLKAGANAATLTEDQYTQAINEAEAFIAVNTRYDWVANYASVPANIKPILQDAASSHAAMTAINYDMSGFTSRTEAQVMLDVNWTKLSEAINLLKEAEYKSFAQKGDTD